MQTLAFERTYETDLSCLAGMRLSIVAEPGPCSLVAVVVGGGDLRAAGGPQLSLKFPDGVRAELPVSPRAFRRFHAPSTTAFVQFYAGRITRFGDLAFAEQTRDEPRAVVRAAGRRAALALGGALCVTALAAYARSRGRARQPARGAAPSRANDGA